MATKKNDMFLMYQAGHNYFQAENYKEAMRVYRIVSDEHRIERTRKEDANMNTRRVGRFTSYMVIGIALALICVAVYGLSTPDKPDNENGYSNDLDAQVAAIGAEVKKQLGKKENGNRIADLGAHKFMKGLKEIRNTPLTRQQFEDIKASVSEDSLLMGYDLADGFRPDPTDLEIEYSRLFWTDMVKQYLERKPLSAADKELIKAQVDDLLQTMLDIANKHGDELQRKLNPEAIEHGRFLLYRDMNDPILPVLKRPMTKKEIEDITAWLQKDISRVMAFEYDEPDFVPAESRGRLIMVVPNLWATVWSTYYQRPSLSPEDMKRKREERHELNRIRSEKLKRSIQERDEKESQGLTQDKGKD